MQRLLARTQAPPSVQQQQEEDPATLKLDTALHVEPHPHPTPDGHRWDWNHNYYPVVSWRQTGRVSNHLPSASKPAPVQQPPAAECQPHSLLLPLDLCRATYPSPPRLPACRLPWTTWMPAAPPS